MSQPRVPSKGARPGASKGAPKGASAPRKNAPASGNDRPANAAKNVAKNAAKNARDVKDTKDPNEIVAAEFIAGAGPGSDLPAPTGAEIAFAGRSNVGKSSLINTLVQRKSLVRTSSTPGSTRQVNLFEVRARDGAVFRLVDLPGYGFAKRSKAELEAWGHLIEKYLKTRVTLAVVVIIVDVRRGLEDDDRELIEFIETATGISRRPVEVVVVATKLDKVPRSSARTSIERVAKGAGRKVVGFSAETGEGRRELWGALRRLTLGTPVSGSANENESNEASEADSGQAGGAEA
ncbi:MAG TPA: ribosome biogenesis GTP-binding protein YihA/YsxC [Polyangiaceae bacterium]|nr:ribosome biogenesis GTP-binding protein YihA/YsxC [Polyangiaceae bacterium]